jgi:uncharacterized protein (TIGR03435 family)
MPLVDQALGTGIFADSGSHNRAEELMFLRLSVLLSLSIAAHSQAPPAFEAATIKRAAPDAQGPFVRPSPGRLSITNMTLLEMIRFAYGKGLAHLEITGGPSWMDKDRYDLEGKAAGQVPLPERQAMLKTLLADRFGLKVHTDSKEVNVYAITVARSDGKLGPKVQPWDGTCGGGEAPARNGNPKSPRCGAFLRPPGMQFEGVTMEIVADMLSNPITGLGRPVVDKTGLTGEYTMQLEFQFRPPAGAAAPVDDFSASLPTALREQWGLKLQSAKGNIDVIVVDQASRPTEN